MSIRSIVWAFEQDIKPASVKFVLVAFSDCVSEQDGCGYPSIDAICAKTSLDRKTVISAFARLESLGVIADTGKRVGRTSQVKVYRLVGMQTGMSHYVYRLTMPETGQFYVGVRSCWGSPDRDQYLGSGTWPASLSRAEASLLTKEVLAVFGDRKQAEAFERSTISDASGDPRCMNLSIPKTEQFQNSDETVPFFPPKSPVFPSKESRKRDTEPSGTVSEPSVNRQKKDSAAEAARPRFNAKAYLVGLGVEPSVADDWLAVRRTKKAAATMTAIDGIAREAVKAGMSLSAALTVCCERGWAGFKVDWIERERAESGSQPAVRSRGRMPRADNFDAVDYGVGGLL